MSLDGFLAPSVVRLAAVGRLVPPVTHDISNALATVLGRIQLHLVGGASGMPRGPGGLDDLYDHAVVVSDKVQTLGSWAREASSAAPIAFAVLSDHVGEVTHLLGRHIARRGLTLHVEIPPSIPPVLVRPLDLKLGVAEVVVALCAAVRDRAALRVAADVNSGRVRLSILVPGLAASDVPLAPEAHLLATLAAEDGLLLEIEEAFAFSMPVASSPVGEGGIPLGHGTA